MEELYKHYHFRSLKKLMELGKEHGISPKEVKEFYNSLQHDI